MWSIVIDEGNTYIKVGLFVDGVLVESKTLEREGFEEAFRLAFSMEGVDGCMIASVVEGAKSRFGFLEGLIGDVRYLSAAMPMPFVNGYAHKERLGIDRLALVAGAVSRFGNRNVLVIDAGTCITFDIVTDEGVYLGGAIAPGIGMRLRAMHNFTSKLPLVPEQDFDTSLFIGNTTESCMLSGVYNNIVCEVEGVIRLYEEKFSNLITILTGGNHFYLEKRIKNRIFASSFILLEGLNYILEQQQRR